VRAAAAERERRRDAASWLCSRGRRWGGCGSERLLEAAGVGVRGLYLEGGELRSDGPIGEIIAQYEKDTGVAQDDEDTPEEALSFATTDMDTYD